MMIIEQLSLVRSPQPSIMTRVMVVSAGLVEWLLHLGHDRVLPKLLLCYNLCVHAYECTSKPNRVFLHEIT